MSAVALATCRALPEPDADQQPLLSALAARGGTARLIAWDDPEARPEDHPLIVVRSTWNYHLDRSAFLRWVERAGSRLLNPPSVLRWNTDKRYLVDLAAEGLAVVPTRFLSQGTGGDLAGEMAALGARVVVLKPTVSAGSFRTFRLDGPSPAAQALLAGEVARRDMMVQPYLHAVEGYGERSLIFIDGALTHAMRKSPRFGDDQESVSGPHPIRPEERALAEAAMQLAARRSPEPLLYGRVDVASGPDGAPLLMELELVEPSLFLAAHPPALARLADAILVRAARRAPR